MDIDKTTTIEKKIHCVATLDDNFKDDSVIVVLDNQISEINKVHSLSFFSGIEIDRIEDLTKRDSHNSVETENFRQILQIFLKNHSKENVLNAVNRLERINGIFSVTPNFLYESTVAANDYYYVSNDQWNLNGNGGINMPYAWNITTGSRKVRVGIIDTGIGQHLDLNNNVTKGYDFFNKNECTDDNDPWHGTAVAGIIGAVGNNSEGVAGINWNITMVPMQACDEAGDFSEAAVVAAINWATKKWGSEDQIDILNYSVSGFGESEAIRGAVLDYPGLFVWSAGNLGVNIDRYYFIEYFNLDNLISVGAVDKTNKRSVWTSYSSSNYGNFVNIYAPGGKGEESGLDEKCPTLNCRNGGYYGFGGTSAAAPHVTGVAALLLSLDPTLTATQLKEAILKGADTISISTPIGSQDVKKLNAYSAMRELNFKNRFSGGNGTKSDPYLINDEQQFRNIGLTYQPFYRPYEGNVNLIASHFKLTNDIVLHGDWAPFPYEFIGSLDGGGHFVSYSITIDESDTSEHCFGLFSRVSNVAMIKNLKLLNCSITSDIGRELTCRYDPDVGILAGSIYQAAGGISDIVIENPAINCNLKNASVGGIAGYLCGTRVNNCKVIGGSITSYSGSLGGMAGFGDIGYFNGGECNTTITKNNYSDGDLVGPIVGNSQERSSVGGTTTILDDNKCLAAGTLITLADGRRVPVETLTGGEMLLVWNLNTGAFDTAPILFIDRDPEKTYQVIDLSFSDGTSVEVIYEHGFWNYNLNRYVYLDKNASQYLGHWFNKQGTDGDGNLISVRVQLTGVEIHNKITAAYSPVTFGHLSYYANGMLSMPGGIGGLFNLFDTDAETMRYDVEAMRADIAEYGLFTYDEFCELVPVSELAFEAFNGRYLKVAIGKGLIDVDSLNALAVRYVEYL